METTGLLMVFESSTNLLSICLKDTALTVVIFLSLTVNLICIQNAIKLFCNTVIFSFQQWKKFWLILGLLEQIGMKAG